MGATLSTARQYIPQFLIGGQNENSRMSRNLNATTDDLTNDTNYQTANMPQINSRLNLINQLLAFTNANGKKSKSANGNLNDFQNISFSSYYYVAGRKFKNLITQTQTFLFGDQLDLAFILSHKPVSFPYEITSVDVPSNYLQSLVNIRKDTLKLVKLNENTFCESAPILNSLNDYKTSPNSDSNSQKYSIEFVFDCDCDVIIRIYYFATEKLTEGSSNQLNYSCACSRQNPNYLSSNSINDSNFIRTKCICLNDQNNPVIYRKGANILFKQPNHLITPSDYHKSAWQFNLHSNYYPIVIECVPLDQRLRNRHSHVTLAYLDKSQTILNTNITANTALTQEEPSSQGQNQQISNDQNLNAKALSVGCISQISYYYQIKAIKQKQYIDGILYSLQEIYGIEKKSESGVYSLEIDNETDLSIDKPIQKDLNISNTSLSNDTNTSEETTTTTSSTKSNQLTEINEQELKGIECVICMCEIRDTLILPCRHLCLCKMCAINLRVQSNNCPICRIPFIALIQIKLFKKKELEKEKTKEEKIELDCEQKLPKLTLQGLSDINIVESGNQDNFIIQIENKICSTDENQNKEIIVKSENKLIKKRKQKLTDFYECVTLYEAFNGAISGCLNSEKNNPTQNKKIKNKIIKKQNNNLEYVERINEVNQCSNQKNQYLNKFKSRLDKINLENLNVPRAIHSNSVLVTPETGQVENLRSMSTHMSTKPSNANNPMLTRSSIDVRKTEEIHLDKFGKSSLSCRAQITNSKMNTSQI